MCKYEGPLDDMSDICLHCDYLKGFLNGDVDVKTARENCALRCKQHDNQRRGSINLILFIVCIWINKERIIQSLREKEE